MKRGNIFLFLLSQVFIGAVVCTGDEVYSVTIITSPSQGPYRLSQRVNFSCLIEPTPPDQVTYQWRVLDNVGGGSTSSSQNISRRYHYYNYNLHYCWYSCEVSCNQTLLGSSRKVIEVHGWLFTEEPVIRSFYCGEILVLNVNISSQYDARSISSLAWYHNGTRITTGDKFTITNEGTSLTVSDMRIRDGGKYEVKINSMSFNGSNSPSCDSDILPHLESLAIHAPVTFLVQERLPPPYDPFKAVFGTYLVTEEQDIILRDEKNYSVFDSYFHYTEWYKNGIRLSYGNMYNSTTMRQNGTIIHSLQITYNSTDDVIGDYIGINTYYYFFLSFYRWDCYDYYRYCDYLCLIIPNWITYWNIKAAYNPPSSVQLHFEDSILSYQESTVIECTAISHEHNDTHNFTLWKNGRILAHNRGSSLRHSTYPSQYGTYRCAVDSVYNTSLLQEKAYFQLLLEDIECDLFMNQQFQDLKRAIHVILDNLCQECDVYSFIFENMTLDCTVSQRFGYLTSALIYSNTDGTITASTLINMLFSWILISEAKPSVLVSNSTITLNQQCPSMMNSVTMDTCLRIVNSGSASTNVVPVAPIESKIIIAVTYPTGIITGIIISIAAIALVICIRKIRRSPQARGVDSHRNEECDKSVEIAMGSNQAYESVDLCYQTGGRGKILETGMMTNEPIYEHPAL